MLNVEVDDLTLDELVDNFREGMLLTLHVDMIMKLQRDEEFYRMLPQFDIVTCDSQFLFFGAQFLGTPFKQRVSGSDFFPRDYNKYKDDSTVTVFICGGAPGIAEIAKEKINKKVGREFIVGTYSPPFNFDRNPEEIDRMIDVINNSKATSLLVGLGAGRQEKFIVKHRARFKYVRTFLPLGGTIDYEADALPRPAPWITDIGLEWLYRLLREPKQRWHRYLVHEPPVIPLLFRQRLGIYRNPFDNCKPASERASA
ncbi:MAG TPA: WecB/TagA/CpsF family glycosyltransferase [Tepidisphaeraceae bacterium]|nr:WecB/TagA/CpsF family glycosyltransferase [Tepidisphaeraceae bacterium]